MLVYLYHNNMQIEQEMAFIIVKSDLRNLFEQAWITSYVPWLLLYAARSKNNALNEVRSKVVDSGMHVLIIFFNPW